MYGSSWRGYVKNGKYVRWTTIVRLFRYIWFGTIRLHHQLAEPKSLPYRNPLDRITGAYNTDVEVGLIAVRNEAGISDFPDSSLDDHLAWWSQQRERSIDRLHACTMGPG